MNRAISFIQNMLLRQVFTLFLVGFVFFTMQIFGFTTMQPAIAETVVSPEGVYYKGTPDDDVHKNLNQSYGSDTNKNKHNSYSSDSKNYKNNADDTEFYRTKVDDGTVSEQAKNRTQGSGGTVTSPEGVYYKGTPDDDVHRSLRQNNYENDTQSYKTDSGNIIEEVKNKIQETAETVTEKLNLNEETPRATKEFLRSTEKEVGKAVEPVTGSRTGYYQIP